MQPNTENRHESTGNARQQSWWSKHATKLTIILAALVLAALVFWLYNKRESHLGLGGRRGGMVGVRTPKPAELAQMAPLPLLRLDSILAATPPAQAADALAAAAVQAPDFMSFFYQVVFELPDGTPAATGRAEVAKVLSDPPVRAVLLAADSTFKNFGPYLAQIRAAVDALAKEVPDTRLPRVVTYCFPYASPQMALTPTGELAIATHFYLGRNHANYADVPDLYQYMFHRFEPSYIVRDAAMVLLQDAFNRDLSGTDLLTQMVYEGMLAHALQRIVPGLPDSIVFGYTSAQMAWVDNSEAAIWAHLVEAKALFSREPMEVQRYMGDGPHNAAMPAESPAKIGPWVGHKIVAAYLKTMDKPDDYPLRQLFSERDAAKVLREGGYRPQ